MSSTPELQGGDTFESRLLQALTEVDARRPAAASPLLHVRRRGRRRPAALVAVVLAALVVAGGATAAASIVLRSDRPDKQLPLGTATVLRPGERTGVKGMGCQPGSRVTISVRPVNRQDRSRLDASRSARISACAVGSCLISRSLAAAASTLPA